MILERADRFGGDWASLLLEKKPNPEGRVLFNPDQPRDESGKWTAGPGGAPAGAADERAKQEKLAEAQTSQVARPLAIFGAGHLDQQDVRRYVQAYGEEFKIGGPLPKDIKPGKVGECYQNATQLALWRRDLSYVEGWAMQQPGGLAILHGWCVDGDGAVIDPTLKNPAGWHYFGVKYDTGKYLKFLLKSKHYGVLGGLDKAAVKAMAEGGASIR